MKLLAIDTSTEACSAALLIDGDVRERFQIAPRLHAELILPMCDSLLDEAGLAIGQLDGIAFGRGPGAFTGVRIAAGVVQGMAWAADLPVVPISSLAAMSLYAMQQHACTHVAAAIDARMGEVYWACYAQEGEAVCLVDEECVIAPDKVSLPAGATSWFAAGTGWGSYREVLMDAVGTAISSTDIEVYPHAAAVARLGAVAFTQNEQRPAEQALPVYLRDKVAEKKR